MKQIFRVLIPLAIISPVVGLAILYPGLPETVALHFDMNGNPDRTGSKSEIWFPVILMAAIALANYFLLPQVYKIDPKKSAAENKPRLKRMAQAIALLMTFISWVIIDTTVKGVLRISMQSIFFALGILWCFLGNYMYNIKPNYFAGIRLPWTLHNEDNWRLTHRLAGKLFFIGGISVCVLSLILPAQPLIVSFVVITFLTILVCGIYSYRLHKKMNEGALNK